MKLPSIQYLVEQGIDALKKHPLVIFSACMAVYFAIFLVEHETSLDNAFPYINLLLCGYLGVPLFLSVDIYVKATDRSSNFRNIVSGVAVLLLIGVYYYLPGSEETLNKSIPYIRYTILSIAAHLLVSFAPFLSRGTLNGFWQFNKVLFLRFLLAVLYSHFIYVGLILALFALDELFKVDVQDELYFEIFIFIAGVFNTWFFAAGVPDEYDVLDGDEVYPKGLRTFILYVLIPLLGLYFLILYSYSIKIIALWSWPSGIITYMIIAVAVLGILAMLLAYPYSIRESGSPIRFLKRGYYWVLIPMVVMLYLAIGIRVLDYGVTINRYITIFLAVWLSGISIYMIVGGKDIRVIPISLFSIILLCSFGPWGLFSVSERSQVNRLEKVLTEAGILDGKIKNEPIWDRTDTVVLTFDKPELNEGILSDSLHNEVVSILYYLEDYHGVNAIEDWFDQSPREIANQLGYSEGVVAMRLMGLQDGYKYSEEVYTEFPTYYSYIDNKMLLDVSGFDYVYKFSFSIHSRETHTDTLRVADSTVAVLSFDRKALILRSVKGDSMLAFDLNRVYEGLKAQEERYKDLNNRSVKEEIIVSEENQAFKGRLMIESISANEEGIVYCNGQLLFTLKE
ncbi:DUF4153 domain-containing protein [Marinoscillum sp. MHG1-6]|uniref:DUF4153 domain-containing protein n=1 Tax=Marinoscillum sp. MHG1-6 TaxID=2959627 RepID=UPI0021571D07|nr:DUF4153 domain-containing protein [Marinoscillum sp. MHG1-6]